MLTLTELGDVSRFLNDILHNEVFLITTERIIGCSGILLAARSAPAHNIIRESENIDAIQFSDDLLGLQDCLRLIYGSTVFITKSNYKSIFKFGKIFEIEEMTEGILNWVAEDLPSNQFWDVYFELIKLEVDDSSVLFKSAIRRYTSQEVDDFLCDTLHTCQGGSSANVTDVISLLLKHDDIPCSRMLKFFMDLLSMDSDEMPSSSTDAARSNSNIDTAVCSILDYLERIMMSPHSYSADLSSSKYFDLLKKLTGACSNMERLRKIASLQNSALNFNKELSMKVSTQLTWEQIRKLTDRSTTLDCMAYFDETTGKELHPCITAEIVLKWWNVRQRDIAKRFVSRIINKINVGYSDWIYCVQCDTRFQNIFKNLSLLSPLELKCIYYQCTTGNNFLPMLKQCIRQGDGKPITISMNALVCTENMGKHIGGIPAFSYDSNAVPPYGKIDGHWYLSLKYDENYENLPGNSFISLITDNQQDVLNLLEHLDQVWLFFVPLFEL